MPGVTCASMTFIDGVFLGTLVSVAVAALVATAYSLGRSEGMSE